MPSMAAAIPLLRINDLLCIWLSIDNVRYRKSRFTEVPDKASDAEFLALQTTGAKLVGLLSGNLNAFDNVMMVSAAR